MSLDKLNRLSSLTSRRSNKKDGRKLPNGSSSATCPPAGSRGPRYRLHGSERDFLRMNSNSYLSLSNHPEVLAAADAASHAFGAGPGAVRFIDGTFATACTARGAHRAVRGPAGRAGLQLGLYDRARPRHHAVGSRHLLDRRCAQSQLHHPRDADRERPVDATRDLPAQRPRRSRAPPRARARRHGPGHRHLRRHLQHARRQRSG